MGSDPNAYTIFGVKILQEVFIENKRLRGCSHTETDAKFCPECGKPMWEEKKVGPYAGDMDEAFKTQAGACFGVLDDYHDHELFIGVILSVNRKDGPYAPPDIQVVEEKVKEFLGDKFSKENFGVWTVLRWG